MSTSSKEKLRSLISILGQLDSGKKITPSLLAESIGVSERTVYRYLTTLQSAGYPIYYDDNKMSYRFADGYSLKRPDEPSEFFQGLELKSRILGASPAGLLSYDDTGQCVMANVAAALVVGGSQSDLLQQNFNSISSWKSSGLLAAAHEVLRTGNELSGDFHLNTTFGKDIWMFCTLSRFERDGRHFLLIVIHDVGDRKRMELLLKQYADCFQVLSNTTLDAFWIINGEGHVIEVNDRACSLYGYSRQELLEMRLDDFEVIETGEEIRAHVKKVLADGYGRFETRHCKKDGSIIDVEVSTARIPNSDNMLAFVRDLSPLKLIEAERLKLEGRRFQAEKFESLGIMSAGIAHDFNNLFAAILGNLDLVRYRLSPDDPLLVNIQRSIDACTSGAAITKQMLASSGRDYSLKTSMNLNRFLEENRDLLASLVPAAIELTTDFGDDMCQIEADGELILMLCNNILSNAVDAVSCDGGTILVSSGSREYSAARLNKNALGNTLPEGCYAFIEVADNGCGMEADVLDHLFDPFFTTKFIGRELGMSAASGIVQAHSGSILVNSSTGCGTTVTVLFPLAGISTR